jgi:hypothetical protein
MFDNLRDQANASAPNDANSSPGFEEEMMAEPARRSPGGSFMGMTAPQRLILSIILLVAVCVFGAMCLFLTGRIGVI